MTLGNDVVLYLLEKACGEHEIIEGLVCGREDALFVADPFTITLVDENDVLSDSQHGVHIVGVDDCGYTVFVGDVVEKLIDENRGSRVKTGVGLVAEEVFRVQGYRAAIATRFCIPPEISEGYFFSAP